MQPLWIDNVNSITDGVIKGSLYGGDVLTVSGGGFIILDANSNGNEEKSKLMTAYAGG